MEGISLGLHNYPSKWALGGSGHLRCRSNRDGSTSDRKYPQLGCTSKARGI